MHYDPFSPEVVADPYPGYQQLHELDAPYWSADRNLWILARYDHVRAAARNPDVFSSAEGVAYMRISFPMMITQDAPQHTRLRRLMSRDFTPRAIEQWRSVVERLVDEHVGAFIAAGGGDWVHDVTVPVPVGVIAELLGVPDGDFDEFKRWSDDIVRAFGLADQLEPDPAALAEAIASIHGITDYFLALAARRRAEPGDDVISKLVAQPDAISDDEIKWMGLLLLVAGNETTTNLLGNMMAALLEQPDVWQQLRADPSLVPEAVEETLRHGAPLLGLFRTVRTEHEVGGVTIPPDSRALLLFAAANRDTARYDEPDRFRLDRGTIDHVAFGNGPHHCLGAHLARMEVDAVLRRLLPHVERFEATGPVVTNDNPSIRGVKSLPLALT